MKFCGPSIFYATIAIIPLYLQYNFKDIITIGLIYHVSFTIIWITLLWFLCKYNLNNIGWILVALPYVFAYFIMKIFLQQAISNPRILLQVETPN